ncbi:flagellar basal body-associated FliL family protein [Hydrogenophaga pseudoflava]|uniref:flagellar basal body-associated FliL family protein n=1 Tax=Hydrogenophaga pseudoflava TaxID=47421 RepID=UPI0027E3CF9F|nr:flagellar basal body-associated FliL family protein [Hydrogenophaga pseudoflava]MDQ7743606.1 flagellar basal body-associated FliL family protein [Hydrogenophaga pseudoflava]
MSAAAAPANGDAPAKPKSKKLLFIIIGVVVLALVGAGAAFFLLKKSHSEDEEDGTEVSAQEEEHGTPLRDPKTPPTFLPLDSMVVNLADPGGNRFAQLGITLQLADAKTGEDMKTYMPSIRNGILILVSQRTAEQMLRADGKEALTQDIMAEISNVMGYDYEHPDAAPEPAPKGKKKKKKAAPNPIEGVLFSSFIVQ